MKNIPNILSFLRILLIPLFIWQIVAGNTKAAAIILILSGITDLLDGYLARHFHWVSDLGKALDPLADKLTQITVCIVLAFELSRYRVLFAIMIVKELIVLGFGGYLVTKGIHLTGAKWFGKVATTVFYTAMVIIIFFTDIPSWLTILLISAAAACTLVAAFLYIPEYRKLKQKIIG